MLKYFLESDELILAVKYDDRKGKGLLHIGGMAKFTEHMRSILKKYFDIEFTSEWGEFDGIDIVWTQTNKIKFVVPIEQGRFFTGIQEMRVQGISLTPTTNLGTVFR